MKYFLFFIFFYITASLVAQTKDSISNKTEEPLFFIEGDSIAVESIPLHEVVLLNKIKFPNATEYKKYLILKRKTRKVYPYAKMAADSLVKIRTDLKDITKKRHRRKYIKQMQEFMEERFTAELKKMSRTEGQILIKLVHRQTGVTMYDLIKDYRSGWKAFWYQKTAYFFDISLKREFNADNVYEDYLIEDILERSFQDDVLVRQPSFKKYDLINLSNKWSIPKPTPIN